MGMIYEDLEAHEGYAARHPRNNTGEVDAYVPACSCGWEGEPHPPTEAGREAAEDAWEEQHALQLQRITPPAWIQELLDGTRRAINGLLPDRPLAALRVLHTLRVATERLTAAAVDIAYRQGANSSDVADAIGTFLPDRHTARRTQVPGDGDGHG